MKSFLLAIVVGLGGMSGSIVVHRGGGWLSDQGPKSVAHKSYTIGTSIPRGYVIPVQK